MRFPRIAAVLLAALATTDATADPSRLLTPDDPAYRSGWQPSAPPTADLKAYDPVDAKAWPAPAGASDVPKSRPGMPGMPAAGLGE